MLETKKRRQRMVDGSINKDTGARTLEDSGSGGIMDKVHILSHSLFRCDRLWVRHE